LQRFAKRGGKCKRPELIQKGTVYMDGKNQILSIEIYPKLTCKYNTVLRKMPTDDSKFLKNTKKIVEKTNNVKN
jgi:hypothetical protein